MANFVKIIASAAQTAAEGKSEEAQSQLLMEKQARYVFYKYYFSVILAEECGEKLAVGKQALNQHRDFAIKLGAARANCTSRTPASGRRASLDKAVVERTKAENDLKNCSISFI
ncbi:hypothetical protein OK016_00555 [Vibrio chagasii]|nr:hypothetical protein [Vibrio chagasii]